MVHGGSKENNFFHFSNKTFSNLFACALFFGISYILICNHEIWRDEAQAYLLSRDSQSLLDLYKNAVDEPHPLLWHILIYPLAHIYDNVFVMQLLHIIIASLSIYVLLRFSPFGMPVKLLLVTNYYLLYEYNIIARNYSISILCIFLLCFLFEKRYAFRKTYGALLFALSNTNMMGIIFVLGFLLYELKMLYDKKAITCYNGIIIILGILGIIVSLFQILHNTANASSMHFPDFSDIKIALANAFLPIPDNEIAFWPPKFIKNSNIYVYIIPIICIFIAIFSLRLSNVRNFFLLFIILLFGYLTFFACTFGDTVRHHGFIFISFIAMEWLLCNATTCKIKENLNVKLSMLFRLLFYFILVIQSICGIYSAIRDYNESFSGAKQISKFIATHELDKLALFSYPDYIISGVIVYGNPKYGFSIQYDSEISFIKYKTNRKDISINEIPAIVKHEAAVKKDDILLLSNEKIQEDNCIKLLFSTGNQIVGDEAMYLYRISNEMKNN